MTDTDPWQALQQEWDRWRTAVRIATLWLRDDDACREGPALDRLLQLAGNVPLGLAAIPARIEPSLADTVARYPAVRVLQHGFDHRNHAGPGEKKAEFGPHRPLAAMRSDVEEGWRTIGRWFPDRAVGIFVPPWNRIDPALVHVLPDCGPGLLSVYGARAWDQRSDRVNTHVDIIDWRGDRGFVGEAAAVTALCRHLQARREGGADPDEPSGVLTHHRDHDPGCWAFLTRLFDCSLNHPAVRWLDPADLARGDV